MPDLPDREQSPGDAVKTRDEESHGVSVSQSERQTEVGRVRTQRGAPDEIPEHVRRRGHEPTDVRVRNIFYAILGLMAAIAVSGVFVGGVLFSMQGRDDTAQVPSVSRASLLPPEPRLQIDPQADRRAFEKSARAQINEYGWTQERGRARIPIERAMELLAAHGWPDLDEQGADARGQTREGSSSGSASRSPELRPTAPGEQLDPDTPPIKAPP